MTDLQEGRKIQPIIIGAGPAGLTAAREFLKHGVTSIVLESDKVVGGISRTVQQNGWRFDIGGHRFFTKVPRIEEVWHEILPDADFMLRPRMSRIYYNKNYFDFGPSHEENGKKINEGILFWKESFGAKTTVQDYYEVNTATYLLLDGILI